MAKTPAELATEAPEAPLQAQSWVKQLDPDSFLIQHGTANTYEKVQEIQRRFPALKDAQIVAAYRPGEKLAHFVIVSGPYSPINKAYDAAKRSGIPNNSWVRGTRNLQDQLKAPL
jgi:septal ring-binding cell division protein DamX